MCSDNPDEYGLWGKCWTNCPSPYYADYQNFRRCRRNCTMFPEILYADTSAGRCVIPWDCPANHYGDNITK